MENLPNQWKLNDSKTQIVDYLGDEILVGAEWRVSNLKNLTLASKAPELREILELILETDGLSQKIHYNLIFNAKRIIKESKINE